MQQAVEKISHHHHLPLRVCTAKGRDWVHITPSGNMHTQSIKHVSLVMTCAPSSSVTFLQSVGMYASLSQHNTSPITFTQQLKCL